MEYRIIKLRIFQGHYYLELEINGQKAYISVEQRPALLNQGYMFVEPQEEWEDRLKVINHIDPDGFPKTLRGFIRSFIIRSVITDLWGPVYPAQFNKKWAGKILYEDEEKIIREQEEREAKRKKR